MVEGAITTRGSQIIKTNKINMVYSRDRFKIMAEGNFSMEVQQRKEKFSSTEPLKEVPFTNNSKVVPLASMTMIHTVIKNYLPKKYRTYHWREGYLSL